MHTHDLSEPYLGSSFRYALSAATTQQTPKLLALYALQRKWRDLAEHPDGAFATTTLNWWHEQLSDTPRATNIPALLILNSEYQNPNFRAALIGILHGYMHWHHLQRIDDVSQLQPTIAAMSGQFIFAWQTLIQGSAPNAWTHSASEALWWIDKIRHLGQNLNAERIWLPMTWMKECNLPAHTVLQTTLAPIERLSQWQAMMSRLFAHAAACQATYLQHYRALSGIERRSIHSIHVLMQLRFALLTHLQKEPHALFEGIMTLHPLRKWWCALRA